MIRAYSFIVNKITRRLCESSIKFLGVWIDENLTWRDHIYTVENKIAKSIRLLYQRKHYFGDNYLKQIYFIYIHAYLNYANIAWASTHKTKLKKVQSKQKHALCIIFNQSETSPSEPLFLSLNVLNVYQSNIFQSVQFMCKIKNKIFRISSLNYSMYHAMLIPPIRTFLKTIRFAISARGPLLWNNCLSKEEKEIDNFLLFKKRAKEKIMELSTAANFFQ